MLTLGNISWKLIIKKLEYIGCPRDIALNISKEAEIKRKSFMRKKAVRLFIISAGSITASIIILVISLKAKGSNIVFFWGILLLGVVNTFRAIYYLITGRRH